MEFLQMYICLFPLIQVVFSHALAEAENQVGGLSSTKPNETLLTYKIGVSMGIINPEKYSLKSFEKDQPLLKKMYTEFNSWAEKELVPLSYLEFLVMHNYGLLENTQEPIPQNETDTRRRKSKKRFKRIVNKK